MVSLIKSEKETLKNIRNIVVVSDLHSGCRMGLCHPGPVKLDDGGPYWPSSFQKKVWSFWEEFWGEFVPEVTRKEPFAVVINGDIIDGVHHQETTPISHNIGDQSLIAETILAPIRDSCNARMYIIRGTSAHTGPSAVEEERIARVLGTIPDREGHYARWELWKYVGKEGELLHFLHHVATTSSMLYESTAPWIEMVDLWSECGRWHEISPSIIIRSHRHRYVEVGSFGAKGRIRAFTTPGWQGKTPLVWRKRGARISQPQFGGVVIRKAGPQDGGELYFRPFVKILSRPKPE